MNTTASKRLLYSLFVVLVWLGFVVEGSHALFSSHAVLAGNTINTGSAVLIISNSQNASSTIYSDTRPGFTYNLSPGQADEKYFILKNESAANVNLDINVSTVIQNPSTEMLAGTSLEFTPVDGAGLPVGTPVSGKLGPMSNQPTPLAVTIPAGSTQRFKIKTSLDSAMTSQNQTVSYDLFFAGVQHVNS